MRCHFVISRTHTVTLDCRYRGGKAPICSTSLDEIGHVTGYGLALYFHFLKCVALSVCAVWPTLKMRGD